MTLEWGRRTILDREKERFGETPNMINTKIEWARTRDELIAEVTALGFPKELGEAIAKELGSPKAMNRMIGYLTKVKPKSAELIVDEMLAISSEISAWKEKKASEAANAAYNDMLNRGLGTEDDE